MILKEGGFYVLQIGLSEDIEVIFLGLEQGWCDLDGNKIDFSLKDFTEKK